MPGISRRADPRFRRRQHEAVKGGFAPPYESVPRRCDAAADGVLMPDPQLPSPYDTPDQLSPAERRRLERRRRKRELIIASIAFVVVLVLTSLQFERFREDRWFVLIFNINFVLLSVIFLLVLRNAFKLLAERRRKVLGSRLRTRLVAAFVAFSLLPCVLMFLVTTKFVQMSMDFWFKEQVENSMDAALDLGHALYEKTGTRLVGVLERSRPEVERRLASKDAELLAGVLERERAAGNTALLGLFTADGREKYWSAAPDATKVWSVAKGEIAWEDVRTKGSAYVLTPGGINDYIFAVLALDGGKRGYLVAAEDMGPGFRSKFDRISRGAGAYKHLRSIQRPYRVMLYSSLGVLTTLIIFGAVWFGFRMAREMSAPMLALAAGTERISKGDLGVRLADNAVDEMGVLIRSFNRMADDLECGRRELVDANDRLEEQNVEIVRHGKYVETVLNNIAAGVISFDPEGIIATVNHAACEILGRAPQALMGRSIEELFPQQDEIITAVRRRFALRPESRTQHSMALRIRGEERRLLVNMVGFSTEGVYRGSVAVFEDITELERMQRMAAWREVARRIAHEIKNPLTPIKLSAQRLARKFGGQVDNPAFTESTDLIVRQVEHLQEMVQEFSAFAKLPEVRPMPGRLEPLLESVVGLFRNSHSGIAWELELPESLPELPLDAEALHRAFINILANAAEALTASPRPEAKVRITAAYVPAMHHVRIDVADNGPGITEEDRSRLFEPYFSRKKGGTGLGLTIVRSIAGDHHGYVRAFPGENGGTVISLELPLT